MSQPHTGPFAIIRGQMYPITAEQYAANRVGKPLEHISGHHEPAPPPRAAAPKAVADDSPEVKRKAAAFDAMMAEPTRQAARARMEAEIRRMGVDPKARDAASRTASKEPVTPAGRALARASMEKIVRAHGEDPVKR